MKWPQRFHTLFRPDRLSYLKKNREGGFDGDCVFCDSFKKGKGFDSLLLATTPHTGVILNKFPYNNGHLLVLPKRHEGDLLALSEAEVTDFYKTLHKVIAALQKVYVPHGFNVGLNLGAAAGAGIPQHLHYHVVPRWNGDMNFFPIVAETKTIPETLEQTFQRLVPYFQ